MKCTILFIAAIFIISFHTSSQQKSNYAYIITSPGNSTTVGWTEVKLVDLATGKLVQNVYESKSVYSIFDARNKKPLDAVSATKNAANSLPVSTTMRQPFDTYCAAAAFDAVHRRLYYTPMGINQLRYIELSTNKIFYFNDDAFGISNDLTTLANHITRMVFNANGTGYALSNDANHFIRFTTNKAPVITDLGSLYDALSNKEVSIHQQKSWGGDMVADRFGNLFLISAQHAIFKINIQTKEAKFLGNISGFPQNFSVNGAAVNANGDLIVSSAGSASGYYVVDMSTLCAGKYSSSDSVFIGSDLANSNFLFDKKTAATPAPSLKDRVIVYPNPVTNGIVHTNFNNLPAGNYILQLLDETGKLLMQKNSNVRFAGQIEKLTIKNNTAKGTYFLKITSQQTKESTVKKVAIE